DDPARLPQRHPTAGGDGNRRAGSRARAQVAAGAQGIQRRLRGTADQRMFRPGRTASLARRLPARDRRGPALVRATARRPGSRPRQLIATVEIDDTRRQILAAEGHLLIQGGPGCGKTTIALLKAAEFLDRLEPEQRVLFLSFSRAAVRQISDRMRGVLNRASRDQLEVRTFHAFFLELVRAHGPLLTGRPSSFIAPDRERRLRADFDGGWPQATRRLAREEGRYVFDRLAGTAATLLDSKPAVRVLYSDTYPLIIVDEFQDTNKDQWQAVQALSRTSTIICLADPDQRIFDFVEGVDEKRIERAIEYLDPTLFDLSKDNHRSP